MRAPRKRTPLWRICLGPAITRDADGTQVLLGVSSVAATSAGFVAVGRHNPECPIRPCKKGDVVIWASADGRSWSSMPSDTRFDGASASDVVAWGSHFVFGGVQNDQPIIWLSAP